MTCLNPDIRNFPYSATVTDHATAPLLAVSELPRERLALAWPLVRAAGRNLDLAGWQAACEGLAERGGGVLGVEADGGMLYGVATYEPRRKPRTGKVLQVDILLSFELSGRAPVRHALCNALFDFARRLDCDALSVALPNRGFVEHATVFATRRPRPRED